MDECAGFHPESAHRALYGLYESDPHGLWQGTRKLFLRKLLPKGTSPERYLVWVSSIDIGWIDRHNVWLCEGGEVVSFSEGNGQQEALVLLPAFGCLHGGKGNFFLNAATRQPWMAELVQ